jgi:Acetyltransferase (GNAT) domain
MSRAMSNTSEVIRELGDGLILRRSTPADAQALGNFNARVHSDQGDDKPDERLAAWTRDLLENPHPTFEAGDFTIVEEKVSGKIVSSLNLISQTWTYGGIPFGVGRPELVGTLPEFRNRGLVRAQFEVVHQWSAERGQKVQAITGIPYYYRQFGYEMALDLGGGRAGFTPQIPELQEGEEEPYRIRVASAGDIPLISELYENTRERYLVNCAWDDSLWHYELEGKSKDNINRIELRVIQTPEGEAVGFLAHPSFRWGTMMSAVAYELKHGISFAAVTPSVIRYLRETHKAFPDDGRAQNFDSFGFWLGREHPLYHVIQDRLPRVRQPYAWYLRVADLADFLRHIKPALEVQLSASPMNGYSGELKITFYRRGLKLVFNKGSITHVDEWKPEPHGHSGDASFPNLTFLQLLFAYRSLEELKYAFPDCWTSNDDARALLEALFPKRPADVWGIS